MVLPSIHEGYEGIIWIHESEFISLSSKLKVPVLSSSIRPLFLQIDSCKNNDIRIFNITGGRLSIHLQELSNTLWISSFIGRTRYMARPDSSDNFIYIISINSKYRPLPLSWSNWTASTNLSLPSLICALATLFQLDSS